MKNRILPGELWAFGNDLVFIPIEEIEIGLTIGRRPLWPPGNTKIRLGGDNMRWQYLPPNRKSGMGWEYFGFKKLDKKLPKKVKIWMLKLIFGDDLRLKKK